ncbi:hypothetical protein Tco_1501238 [Tanacetum coccineum]
MPSSPKPTVDYLDDLDFFNDFETQFPAIVYNDGLTSKPDLENGPSVSSERIDKFETSLPKYDEEEQNVLHFSDSFTPDVFFSNDLKMTEDNMAPLPHHNMRHIWLRYQIEEYTEGIVHDFERRLDTIWDRSVNRVHILDFEGLTLEMRQDLAVRLRMVYTGEDGHTCKMSDTEMGLDVADTLCFQLGGSERIDPDKRDLRDYWIEISSDRDFLGPAPSYVHIRDPVRRLCHRMIACTISGRGQGARRHAEGRKSGARLSRGYFIGRLADHFGLVSDEGLRGLSVISRELPMIDLHELSRLNICGRFGYIWAWVAPGPERQLVVVADAPKADEDAPDAAEGAQADPTPAQAPTPPPPVPQPWIMSQRIERVKEEMF